MKQPEPTVFIHINWPEHGICIDVGCGRLVGTVTPEDVAKVVSIALTEALREGGTKH